MYSSICHNLGLHLHISIYSSCIHHNVANMAFKTHNMLGYKPTVMIIIQTLDQIHALLLYCRTYLYTNQKREVLKHSQTSFKLRCPSYLSRLDDLLQYLREHQTRKLPLSIKLLSVASSQFNYNTAHMVSFHIQWKERYHFHFII
jgi:hypothetical protein